MGDKEKAKKIIDGYGQKHETGFQEHRTQLHIGPNAMQQLMQAPVREQTRWHMAHKPYSVYGEVCQKGDEEDENERKGI